jgi:hypothetical protein
MQPKYSLNLENNENISFNEVYFNNGSQRKQNAP